MPENQETMEAKNGEFQKEIMQIDKSLNDFLTYSEIYGGDKAVTSVLESWEKEEKGFMYDIIC
ncbi:hypothetical protein D7X25_24275 [bacterium 1XD42-8]|nr:hypothetical protein D7X25_24275 [bacterium 1XD42-8]